VSASKLDAVAAVDLGSNSFHLVVARVVGDSPAVVDRLRERVRLAGGLDEHKRLDEATMRRALTCLERFGERLRGMPEGSVRAVGTSALRVARNAPAFLERASEVLGHRIEVVSGQEEARLIYLGVAHDIADGPQRRLVVDIGGGSTECILGEHYDAILADSLHMGCVNWSLRWFPRGLITREHLDQAILEARREVRSLERQYKQLGWGEAIGSSGSILAIAQILRAAGWCEQGISERGLRKLRKELVDLGRVDRLQLPGMSEDRRDVLVGGVAILSAIFEGLELEHMRTSQGAMREGLLHDLLGRIRHEDLRERTIRSLGERYHADLAQAGRVQATALELLQSLCADWKLDDERGTQFLSWAARLHEIGLTLSHQGYHKHGAYILENSDLPGFSRQDQQVLAALVRLHRRKFESEELERLPATLRRGTQQLAVILRLAVLFNRGRGGQSAPRIEARAQRDRVELALPPNWLRQNPLARADLEEERLRLAECGLELHNDPA
jgi:exopolyphosphatase/guanosine-5'-triphosphate,3'-diphosphate pyrophosphatase